MMQQRASEKQRLLEAIVEAASKRGDPDPFFASAADFLSKVGFRTTVTDTRVSKTPNTVEPPNGDRENKETLPKEA